MQAETQFVGGSMPRIVALQGGAGQAIQALMDRCARRWSARGARVAGLIEAPDGSAAPHPRSARLARFGTVETFPLFQDLGPMATGCRLDPAGVVAACVAVCGDIRHGCDLVVLNKFGKLEASRNGLMEAFTLAAERDIPILTAVSPAYQAAWEAFSAPLGLCLPPEELVLDGWWRSVRADTTVPEPCLVRSG